MHSLKPLIATLLLISAAFFCLFTNPTEEEYLKWAQTQYQAQQTTSEKGLAEVFLQFVRPSLLKKSTSSTNYLVFTLFETKFDGSCIQTIGILDHFIPLPVVSTKTSS